MYIVRPPPQQTTEFGFDFIAEQQKNTTNGYNMWLQTLYFYWFVVENITAYLKRIVLGCYSMEYKVNLV